MKQKTKALICLLSFITFGLCASELETRTKSNKNDVQLIELVCGTYSNQSGSWQFTLDKNGAVLDKGKNNIGRWHIEKEVVVIDPKNKGAMINYMNLKDIGVEKDIPIRNHKNWKGQVHKVIPKLDDPLKAKTELAAQRKQDEASASEDTGVQKAIDFIQGKIDSGYLLEAKYLKTEPYLFGSFMGEDSKMFSKRIVVKFNFKYQTSGGFERWNEGPVNMAYSSTEKKWCVMGFTESNITGVPYMETNEGREAIQSAINDAYKGVSSKPKTTRMTVRPIDERSSTTFKAPSNDNAKRMEIQPLKKKTD